MELNVLIAGVGGQGNLFASSILAGYALGKDYQVLGVETIGAAQRGGSVVSHLRISDSAIFSPLIPPGKVDVILGFEAIEMLRHFHTLSAGGKYLLNDYREPTVLCNMGIDRYPSDEAMAKVLRESGKEGWTVGATAKAREMGNSLMTNVVMVGALCAVEPFFNVAEVRKIVADRAPEKVREQNLKAFDAGTEMARSAATRK